MSDSKWSGKEPKIEELDEIFKKHELWLKSKRRQGECADLSGANLNGMSVPEIDLTGAIFTEASLMHTHFEGTTNLFDYQLIQANLALASLPKSVDFSGLIEAAVRAASYARKLFTPLSLFCIFFVAFVLTAPSEKIYKFRTLIDIDISYPLSIMAGSVGLLIVYLFFLSYMKKLWMLVSRMPSFFPNGVSVNIFPEPWLLMNFVCLHVKHVGRAGGIFWPRITAFLIYAMVPSVSVIVLFSSNLYCFNWAHLVCLLCTIFTVCLGCSSYRSAVNIFSLSRRPLLSPDQ